MVGEIDALWLFTLTHLSLTQRLRAQDRDDALYHAKSSICDGRGGIVGFRFRELGPI